MIEVLQTLEGLDDNEKEAIILQWVEHENSKVRKWAIGALTRVHGVEVIPIFKSLRAGEAIAGEIEAFINRIAYPSTWDMFSDRERQRVSGVSLLGVEVVTERKTAGNRTLFSEPEIIEQGSVRVLRVFGESHWNEGDVLPLSSGVAKTGSQFLVFPENGEIHLPATKSGPWVFPPGGPWDGEMTMPGGGIRPGTNFATVALWLEKLSADPKPYADEFLDEALKNAPLSLAFWALRSYRQHLRKETLADLKDRAGLATPRNEGGQTSSLRDMMLYDVTMRTIYGNLWKWDRDRITLLEKILAHPLADEEEAWLFYHANGLEYHPSSASATDWKRMARAARNNSSWKENQLDPRHRMSFDFSEWHYIWAESRSNFDATTAVDYLIERWAIPDYGPNSERAFVNLRGNMLGGSLPLKSAEVKRLRTALAKRLIASGNFATYEEAMEQANGIQSMTWEEIINQPIF